MLESLYVKNFTIFPDTRLRFAGGLNVIAGENGPGKTYLLKLPKVASRHAVDRSIATLISPTATGQLQPSRPIQPSGVLTRA